MGTDDGQIRTLETTCQLLTKMESGEFVSVTDVADDLGVSKGTVHYHLSTLVENGLVVREDGKYRLGLRLYEIGAKIQNSYGHDAITRTIKQLSEECNTRTHFIVEQHDYAFCLQSSGSVETTGNASPPIRAPLHRTAPGRAILSAYSPERKQSYLESHSENLNHPAQTRERPHVIGRSFLEDERFQSIATVVEQNDEVIGAVSLVFDPSRVEEDTVRTDYSNQIRRAANEIAVNLTLVE